ncbi:CHAT domain-containing protein [Nostoc flagelliforme FACHB-838]|uniref:CHAT domain-containing protein n=1 Tax=Nostoc flagelliforme FACHB-838 TaxID=2692904 RepID=A0ABR8DYG9_9NOSO|nr:CHAT domain-containing protein [Nostoc flagelliforme]MBD2534304.1 CHAT domain-containing protein [Nostoc flagelliforme FACHB-838]
MARKRRLFIHYLWNLKYLSLGLSLSLLVILCLGEAKSQPTPSEHSYAQSLTQGGYQQLHRGQVEAAQQTWQAAYKAYKRLNDSNGMTGSLINQSLAFQASGMYPQACQVLVEALEMKNWLCNSSLQERQYSLEESQERLSLALQKQPMLKVRVIALRNLGDVLRMLGDLEASLIVLSKSSVMAKRLNLESNFNNQLLLSQANTERTLYNQAKSRYQMMDDPEGKQKVFITAKSKINLAFEQYQNLRDIPVLPQLYQLSLLLEMEKWPDIANVDIDTRRQAIKTLIKQLLTTPNQFEQLPLIESIYARLNFVETLTRIAENSKLKQFIFPNGENSLKAALFLAQQAQSLAQKLDNERAESYASGTIGNIYGSLGQELESKKSLEQAVGLAQSVKATDIAYKWQWQLGRLYQRTNNFNKATQAYTAAINSLDQVRGSILAINPEIQWEFKEKVEPVYLEYMELNLSENNPNLVKVIKTQEKLKIAELESFLQCGKLTSVSLIDSPRVANLPPIIHLIKLKNRAEVIVQTPQGSLYRHTVDFQLLSDSIDSLVFGVQNQELIGIRHSNLLVYPQTIYNLVFAPIKKHLPDSGNLILVLDTYFQNLPISMLYDGENYLVKHYNISTASSSNFWQSRALNPKNIRALIAGISEIGPSFNNSLVPESFKALPEVEKEVASIKTKTAPGSELLLNAQFTTDDFQRKMEDNQLEVVHLSTHGQFSSDPEKTFVLAWDVPVTVKKLKFLLKTERSGIDLLVLSACQTAKGDRRSALGIAGIASQAGARSTVASLWLVEAESTTLLMEEFYRGLRNGLPKAEALRFAQLKLMSNHKYEHPYFWAGFVLVGDWL